MAKYKVKHTTILHDGKSRGEGSIIELTDEQAKKLADFVELVPEAKKAETTKTTNTKTSTSKTNKTSTKAKTETKAETKSEETSKTEGSAVEGGADGK